MPSAFLCPTHRQWLIDHPSAARSYLADTQDTGQFYREQGLWLQALPFLGCAYEISEIVLSTQTGDKTVAVINFTSCAILLADTFGKAQLNPQSRVIFAQAQGRLQTELGLNCQTNTLQSCMRDCIQALNKGADTAWQAAANGYNAAIH